MNKVESDFAITPDTKLAALLEHYPQLEDVLIEMAPAFKRLRNPILKKTVAKVATLRQASQIGAVDLGTLINTLQAKVGMEQIGDFSSAGGSDSQIPPAWWDKARIVQQLDARPMIEAGEQPINQVMSDLKTLKENEIYELIAPFTPAPLIDMAKKQGFRAWSQPENSLEFHTYFGK